MDDRKFLHDNELLLCSQRSSPAVLVSSALRGLVDALIAGIVLSLILLAVLTFVFETSVSVFVYVAIFVIAYGIVFWLRWNVWAHSAFRITSERILLQAPESLFHPPLKTIKWSQYQESHVGHRTMFDYLFLSRPIGIRYGTADAQNEASFPSLRYGQDLKHYLDKIDSAVRKNDPTAMRPFVAKPRGKRDVSADQGHVAA